MKIHNILLFLALIILIGFSGLFSGSETGLYRLSKLRLRLGVEKRRLSFILLSRCVHDSSGLLLTILIGNNLVNYLTTSIITYMLSSKIETWQLAEIFATILTVPILFTFGESIPKNLFFYRADALMPYTAPFLYIFHRFLSMCGAIGILRYISDFFMKLAGSSTSPKTAITSAKRHAVEAILQDTHEEGILSSVQTDIINRLVKISNVHIKTVMTPMEKVLTANINSDNKVLLDILKEHNLTRLPVIDTHTENVTGYINIYETLSSSQKFDNLVGFLKPIKHIDAETNITEAIHFMQSQKQKIVLVNKYGRFHKEKPVGIITMKDLVEELLGELGEW
ncbi:MAG: DUF21 domain-containing protein [Sedimentisphaerales bacterium]|nr:DUF21 domain-containing protein [Sedimentisphaerales bacterium]